MHLPVQSDLAEDLDLLAALQLGLGAVPVQDGDVAVPVDREDGLGLVMNDELFLAFGVVELDDVSAGRAQDRLKLGRCLIVAGLRRGVDGIPDAGQIGWSISPATNSTQTWASAAGMKKEPG